MSAKVAIDPALRAAGFVGTWNTNVLSASSILDEGAAAVMAGDIALAGRPLPLEIALQRTHPEDREWVFQRIRRVRQTGGPVSAEFRILSDTGHVRWMLVQGSLAPDEAGTMRGHGAYIETTHHRSPTFLPPRPIELPEEAPLIVAADRSLEAHAAIAKTGHRRLQQLSDLVLFEIGRLLARSAGN
jgi:hypothetical protein